MPERSPGGVAGDVLGISWQVAVAVGVPLFAAAWLSQQVTQDTALQLVVVIAGLVVAGAGMYLVIRRYMAAHPVPPTTEAAREAGRRWDREIDERARKKEADQEIQ
ncbi:MAG: hypothetical protein HYY42_00485 [Chloroflexi bacterium]|nr:hypothetical protein [Chloroflexota bacterium]MBI2982667.1 hypothetical protein [Chloroflexota bacterium]